jgi:hypothetical protein
MRTHFLQSGHPKKLLAPSRGSDVSSMLIELCTHYLPSGRLKNRLSWRFQGV